jgi:Ca2+/H+ antiporter, TMEM165/GDT1 family
MLAATLLSLGVVFLAELGDRSQLITLTYALRYRWWVVLTGVAIAAFGVHGFSVAIGHFLGATLPARAMSFASAFAFLIFAAWTWREGRAGRDGTESDENAAAVREPRFALLTVVSSFTLAEMSDKTTLATVTLASDHNWAGVWIGSTIGMILADALAIGAGLLLHQRLPERLLHTSASLLFLVFGLWMLFDGALGWRSVAIGVTGGVALATAAFVVAQTLRRRRGRREEVPLAARSPEVT